MTIPGPEPATTPRTPNHRVRTIVLVALAVITVGLILKGVLTPAPAPTASAHQTPGPASPVVGHYAPDITLRDLSDNPVSLSSLRGKVVVLNFWYAACEPCKYEMPALESAYEAHKGQGLVILGVDVVDDPATADTFIHQVGITYPVVRDVDLRAATLYRLVDTPSSFIIDRNGVIRYRVVGTLDTSTLQTRVAALLAEK